MHPLLPPECTGVLFSAKAITRALLTAKVVITTKLVNRRYTFVDEYIIISPGALSMVPKRPFLAPSKSEEPSPMTSRQLLWLRNWPVPADKLLASHSELSAVGRSRLSEI